MSFFVKTFPRGTYSKALKYLGFVSPESCRDRLKLLQKVSVILSES